MIDGADLQRGTIVAGGRGYYLKVGLNYFTMLYLLNMTLIHL